MTIAGTRAGKGRSALLPNLITLPPTTPILALDTKGSLARHSARWRAEGLGQKIGVLDPFDCSGENTRPYRVAFNPLQMLQTSDRRAFVPNCKLIADSLIVIGEAHNDQHWRETAKQICSGLIAHVATHANYASVRDLVTVWRLASELASPDPDGRHRFWLEREMLESDAVSGMVRNAARNFYNRSGGEFSSVLSNLTKHLDWIAIECMQDALRGDSFDLFEMPRRRSALYVALPVLRAADLSGWQRLLVQMALAAWEENGVQNGPQAVFLLDEFHALGKMQAIEKAIAQIAGFGVKLWIVLQDLNQLKLHYPTNFETFLGNAGLIQCFGVADVTTLDYISKLLGQATTLTRSTNLPTFEQAAKHAATGESWSLSNHPLMTGEEIGRFFARDDKKLRQLILRPGYRPMLLQRGFYDQHAIFQGKYDEN
ncbi:type IV secretory system conjugative DNA transfer family protein [Lignipirellula cremea]|nr:type IV secretory system conjugative DNA transfer family protein [Lignipirellula cremea]